LIRRTSIFLNLLLFLSIGISPLVAATDPLNRRSETTFDANGQPTEVTDPLNRTTQFTWNARGEKTRTTNALTHYSNSTLDANGNQTSLRNRRAKNYTFAFDNANRPISTTTPTGKVTSMTYFKNHLAKTITEPSTQTTTLAYNGKNLVSSKTDPTGSISYVYDSRGLLTTVTEGTSVITRTYDERGRIKTYTNADGDLIQYGYDSNNNLTRLTYPDGKQVNYTYNARNLLESVTDWNSRVTTYQYDRLGRLTGTIRPNGTANIISHDAASQLTSIKDSANGKLISYLKFDYDAAGQITRRFRAPLVNSDWRQPSFSGTYDDDNRLATVNGQSVTHDADGNMIFGPIRENSGHLNLSYNSRNQLTNADGISYSYDAEGQRRTITSSTGTIRDVIDPSGSLSRLLVRHNADNTKTYYVYGLALLYEVDAAEKTKTYHFDQVGSTIARTDDTGKVIGSAEYSAYGICYWKQGDMATPFLYNGQAGVQTDSNGLLNMRARYYSPYLMRFLNADPIGFSGGSNWFAYADGNPISLSDPFGLCAKNWQTNSMDCLTGKPYDPSIYGRRPVEPITSQYGHNMLDGFGLLPGLGEPADVINGIWYAAEGNAVDSTFSFAGAIPFAGWAATGGKILRHADEAADVVRHADEVVDLAPTLNRIDTGGSFPHRNDGSTFRNREGILPQQPEGYYKEFVHPTPGVSGPGAQRIVQGQGGERYYTPDHYKTFIPLGP
jgi:RHS repeat-associated protein